MPPKPNKYRHLVTTQNWVAFALIVIGIALGISGYGWAWYLVWLTGVVLGLFFVIKRSLSKKPKKLSALAVIAILCWLYVAISSLLFMYAPLLPIFIQIYGEDLAGLFNWGASLILPILAGTVLLVIEIFEL